MSLTLRSIATPTKHRSLTRLRIGLALLFVLVFALFSGGLAVGNLQVAKVNGQSIGNQSTAPPSLTETSLTGESNNQSAPKSVLTNDVESAAGHLNSVPSQAAASKDKDTPLFCPERSADWSKLAPAQVCTQPGRLSQALQLAGRSDSHAVVVLYRGHIVAEQYWNDWNRNTTGPLYSATKSLVSTLYGIALDEQQLTTLDQAAANFVPRWQNNSKYSQIQLKHLLSMTSGLEGGRGNFARGILARNEERFVTQLDVEHPAGQHWEYQNSAYRLLFPILERITNSSLPAYSKSRLFDPLGMEHANWEHKRLAAGQYTHMEMSALDAARFGLLIQRQGDWNGKQIVSQSWIAEATQPYDSSVHNCYGYLWWLNCGESYRLPMRRTQHQGAMFPHCPTDTIAALGAKGQKIYVIPSLELVVVRLGDAVTRNAAVHDEFDLNFLGQICSAFGYED